MYDVLIIGAGAAGLMAAHHLKQTNLLVLERNASAGKKLLITGGGRCNLTNLKPNQECLNAISYNKKFLYSSFSQCGPRTIFDFFNTSVPLKEEENNEIFPISNKAKDILDFLIEPIKDKIRYNQTVTKIEHIDEVYLVSCGATTYQTKNLIVACGGGSFKNTGSCGDHLLFAKQLEHPVVDLFPAETSLIAPIPNLLAGTSFSNVTVTANKHKSHGHFIFTHKGVSGSSIMKISEHVYLEDIHQIHVDFAPNVSIEQLEQLLANHRESKPETALATIFTKRFSDYLVQQLKIKKETKCKQLIHREVKQLIELIKHYPLQITKCADLDQAYVSGGGIHIKHIHPKTMESKLHKNCYFIGECLDLHGPIGGYNLTIAFSTATSCAKAILQ